MTWRYKPAIPVTNPNSSWSKELTEESIRKVMKDQLRSVYGLDYVDLYKRNDLQRIKTSYLPELTRAKTQIFYNNSIKTINTENRFHYQTPKQIDLLRVPTNKFIHNFFICCYIKLFIKHGLSCVVGTIRVISHPLVPLVNSFFEQNPL